MSDVQDQKHAVNITGRLLVKGRSLALGQICCDWLRLIDPCDMPDAVEAELIVTVSGTDKRYSIILPHGINSRSDVVKFF
jgi:hypothetical protein